MGSENCSWLLLQSVFVLYYISLKNPCFTAQVNHIIATSQEVKQEEPQDELDFE